MTRPGFTGSPLDRADHLRSNAQGYAAAWADPAARILQLDGIDPVLDGTDLSWTSITAELSGDAAVLLGLLDGIPHFAPIPAERHQSAAVASRFQILAALPPDKAAIYGTARSLLLWHGNHLFCGVCGFPTEVFRAGWGRRCTNCGTEHFPRVDPVVIMLAEFDDKVLVGRQRSFPPGFYSALAGFLEPGESIEEAVARELAEEAGVTVSEVRYIASQPWPYPAQLMIAAIARVTSAEITLDQLEIEQAIWVDRPGVAAALAGVDGAPFSTPPPFAIAHTLLTRWVEGA
jgi:NAD+ diphosphatase